MFAHVTLKEFYIIGEAAILRVEVSKVFGASASWQPSVFGAWFEVLNHRAQFSQLLLAHFEMLLLWGHVSFSPLATANRAPDTNSHVVGGGAVDASFAAAKTLWRAQTLKGAEFIPLAAGCPVGRLQPHHLGARLRRFRNSNNFAKQSV